MSDPLMNETHHLHHRGLGFDNPHSQHASSTSTHDPKESILQVRSNMNSNEKASEGHGSIHTYISAGKARSQSKVMGIWKWCTQCQDDWWWFEIISLTLSTICTVVIVVLLWRQNGKPLSEWKNNITIDATLSLLASFSKAALLLPTSEALGQVHRMWLSKNKDTQLDTNALFRETGHGKRQATALIIKTRGVSLASIGAAIILLSLPLDLFYQQIVALPSKQILNPGVNATVARTTQYETLGTYINDSSSGDTDSLFQAFLPPHWLGEGPVANISFGCPTGNCTFQPFDTLAVDFQCQTLSTDLLTFGCQNSSDEWTGTFSDTNTVRMGEGLGASNNISSCGYYLQPPYADELQLMSGYKVVPNGQAQQVLATRFYPLIGGLGNRISGNGSINFADVNRTIVDFILVSTPGGMDGARNNNTPVVSECEVHWAVHTLNTSVVNNILQEQVTERTQFNGVAARRRFFNKTFAIDEPINMTKSNPYALAGEPVLYGLGMETAHRVQAVWSSFAPSTITQLFAGAESRGPATFHAVDSISNTNKGIQISSDDGSLPWDGPIANVSARMESVVETMNRVLRSNMASSNRQKQFAIGKAFETRVIIEIRWAWISLPIALWLFAVVFVAITMFRGEGWRKLGHPTNSTLSVQEEPLTQRRTEMRETTPESTDGRRDMLRSANGYQTRGLGG